MKTKIAPSLYVKHREGGTHFLSGRKAAKLYREIAAGRGGAETTALAEAGYEGFLNKNGDVMDFEGLTTSQFDGV